MSDHSFIATRRSLLTRLKSVEDNASWDRFSATYWRLLYSVALKSGLSQPDAEEVVQETVISVARKMPGFRYDPAIGSFKSWLLNITRRRIADQFRKNGRIVRQRELLAEPSTGTAPIERLPDPVSLNLDAAWEEEWQAHVLQVALERIKAEVSARQFQIFELYALKDWPVERIQKTLGVSAGQVYLAKLRVGKLLKSVIAAVETDSSVV